MGRLEKWALVVFLTMLFLIFRQETLPGEQKACAIVGAIAGAIFVFAPDDRKQGVKQMAKEIAGEIAVVIKTDLPANTDQEIEACCSAADTIIMEIENLVLSLYRKGGQFHRHGFTISLEDR